MYIILIFRLEQIKTPILGYVPYQHNRIFFDIKNVVRNIGGFGKIGT